jgi:serine/threonine protein kinase
MDMNTPDSGESDRHAENGVTGAPRADDAAPSEDGRARDCEQGSRTTPAVELYSPPLEMIGLSHGRRARGRFVAVDARGEAPSRSPSGPTPHHHSAALRDNACSVNSLLGMYVAGFRIGRVICSRGLGAVYEGVQEWPPRSVAIKVSYLDCSPDMARRYERRSTTVQALKHPLIAATYSSGVEPWSGLNVPFQVMEHVDHAIPLRRFVVSRGLSLQQRLALFREVCDAVAYGHQQGVFHGYLTSHKVLLDPTGSPKVVDYCNCLAVAGCESIPSATRSEPSLLDLCYLSPEQYVSPASAIDARADVYSLGAMLYELLTGLHPYDVRGRSIPEAADLIRRTRPMSPRKCNERITPAVMSLLGNCLKKNRSERLRSAEDIVFALDEVLGDRRHLVRRANRRGLIHASGHGTAWTVFTAAALKALPPLTSLVQQIVSMARRRRSIYSTLPWPWIGLFLMGWLFLWIVAEIAREVLSPHPVHTPERRSETHFLPPVQTLPPQP